MPNTPPLFPAETFTFFIRWLVKAVIVRCVGGHTPPMIVLIIDRIRHIHQRFQRLTARLAAGTYAPRRYNGRKPATPKPRRKNPLPQNFGWLLALEPGVAGSRSQLQTMLQTPEMVALIAAAPASMARVLRPLCWMLRLTPPPLPANPGSLAAAPPDPAACQPAPPPAAPPRPAPPNALGFSVVQLGLSGPPKPA